MAEIRIYKKTNDGFVITGITDFATEINYTSKFYDIGIFSIKIPFSYIKDIEIAKNYIVMINRGEFIGILQEYNYTEDFSGFNVTLSGYCLKGINTKRIIMPSNVASETQLAGYDAVVGPTEYIIKHYVTNNAVNAIDTNRNISYYEVATNQNRGTLNDKYVARFNNLADVIKELGEAAELGTNVSLNLANNKMIFDVIKGTSRIAGQSIVPPIVFSIEHNSAEEINVVNSIYDMKNVFYSTKSGAEYEDEALTATYYKNDTIVTDFERQEIHLNINTEHPTPGQEYVELKRLTEVEMENYLEIKEFKAKVNNSVNKFGIDYFLGDYVTIFSQKRNIQADVQVTEVNVIETATSKNINLTFGKPQLNLLQLIKRDLK